jgi:hypothetical protein
MTVQPKVTLDDLRFASEWVASYDPGVDVDECARRDRVVAWLDSEIIERTVEADLRNIDRERKQHGRKALHGREKTSARMRLRAAYRHFGPNLKETS